jgi:regulatory protein
MYGAKELKGKMQERGYLDEDIKKVIDLCKERKYINDRALAEMMIRNYTEFKLVGYNYIRLKLKEKQLSDKLIEEVIAEQFTEDVEEKSARQLLDELIKKHGRLSALDYTEKQKIARRLHSRGFRFSVVNKVMNMQEA